MQLTADALETSRPADNFGRTNRIGYDRRNG
ncbi:hypothetical protein SNOG_06016 [Parastagonospora nodorum SN15]|uniref:Uncharacterized protein n=1 Tax=Phaeosphaeria nodorum (strain SN15 / ATCC MYA-4574 / FGSC 10173) TaxID=321614 RepID=Q0UQE8_PHANO|nr:hypothetical protein SNOG_06016 [Parastagonospora nodorum SN15]EAT87080.1 hypothetical protein SNOG_06016 [Parastagonospora nodorum SN15]